MGTVRREICFISHFGFLSLYQRIGNNFTLLTSRSLPGLRALLWWWRSSTIGHPLPKVLLFSLSHRVIIGQDKVWLIPHGIVVSYRLQLKNTINYFVEFTLFSIWALTCLGRNRHIGMQFINFASAIVPLISIMTPVTFFCRAAHSCSA